MKVAIVGPESTGKSMLAEALAARYQSSFVPEFARDYLPGLGRKYTYEDVIYIAGQQQLLEKKAEEEATGKYIFYDTTLLTIKIWFKVVFGRVPAHIEQQLLEKKYDLYLLMDIDMPWVPDPLREHPHYRKELLQMHIEELRSMGASYFLINGEGIRRTSSAIDILEKK